MAEVHVLAIDLAKRSFQVCGTDRGGVCGCIWTPPDCNSFDGSGSWSQLLTYIRLHNAA